MTFFRHVLMHYLSIASQLSTNLCLMEFPTLIHLDQFKSILRVVGLFFFIFIQILIEHSVSKQW